MKKFHILSFVATIVFGATAANANIELDADWSHGIYTFDKEFNENNPVYHGSEIELYKYENKKESLIGASVWPGYYIQSICSSVEGAHLETGSPEYDSDGRYCWCRLKRKSDGANGVFVSNALVVESAADCAHPCVNHCASDAGDDSDFRAALMSSFE
ncbi:MAG: hypothetical protein LBH81_00470 [Rickettsiales bacterium]|jgi:hypothetical protein|nr:hypothetical protein [Rickettsiales bacterium]